MNVLCYTIRMTISLSTSYFAGRQLTPHQIAEYTAKLGFDAVELGYFTRDVDLPAWEDALRATGLSVSSLHAFCPMPLQLPQLGPEIFSLAAPDPDERAAAIQAMLRTLDAAVRFNAGAIVTHGGRVDLQEPGRFFGSKPYRSQLSHALAALGHADMELVERERHYRERAAGRWMDAVSFALDILLPRFEEAKMVLAFENLPGLEAFPDPAECAFLRERFPTDALAAWYDIGHGERKARTGDWPVAECLALTADFTAGAHIHDVRGIEEDHCAPGEGSVDFGALMPLLKKDGLIRVFEPAPSVAPNALRAGLALIRELLQ